MWYFNYFPWNFTSKRQQHQHILLYILYKILHTSYIISAAINNHITIHIYLLIFRFRYVWKHWTSIDTNIVLSNVFVCHNISIEQKSAPYFDTSFFLWQTQRINVSIMVNMVASQSHRELKTVFNSKKKRHPNGNQNNELLIQWQNKKTKTSNKILYTIYNT